VGVGYSGVEISIFFLYLWTRYFRLRWKKIDFCKSRSCDKLSFFDKSFFFLAAPQLILPSAEDNVIEMPRGGTQQACTDEDFLTLLDLANSDSVTEWYTPSEYYAVPCASPLANMDAVSNPQIVTELDNTIGNHNVVNHIWDFGTFGSSCNWNPPPT